MEAETSFILPWFLLFLLSLSSSGFSSAKITPWFPSSINVKPEQEQLSVSVSTKTKLYEAKYFTQTLDHFNYQPQSYQTFQQRYLINYKYWGGADKLAPIFVYTGNEGDIEWFAQNTGFMFDTAPHFKALLVFIEVPNYVHSNSFFPNLVWRINVSVLLYISCGYGSIGSTGNQFRLEAIKMWLTAMRACSDIWPQRRPWRTMPLSSLISRRIYLRLTLL